MPCIPAFNGRTRDMPTGCVLYRNYLGFAVRTYKITFPSNCRYGEHVCRRCPFYILENYPALSRGNGSAGFRVPTSPNHNTQATFFDFSSLLKSAEDRTELRYREGAAYRYCTVGSSYDE
jgi:hypothetical protein